MLRDPRVGWVLIPTESHRAHYLSKVGLSRDRVTFLPPGVDVAAAGAIPYRGSDGATVVGFTGPCDATSGVENLVAALKQVSATHAVRGLYRAASSADADRFVELVADTLPDSAVPLVDVAPLGCADFPARIDVFADCGTDDHVSVAMIEAMACARPVLALAVGGTPELVRDGQTALLVPPDRPEALAAALTQLTDPERRRVLGEAGRSLAGARYDLAVVGQAMVELYRVAIGGTRNSSAKAEGSTAYRRISDTRIGRTG
jgi:glycosyltransferase involved in cell wall biosynthesis